MLYTPFNWDPADQLLDSSGNQLIPGKIKFAWVNIATGQAEAYQLDDAGLVTLGLDGKPLMAALNLSLPLTVVHKGVTDNAGTTRRTAEGGA